MSQDELIVRLIGCFLKTTFVRCDDKTSESGHNFAFHSESKRVCTYCGKALQIEEEKEKDNGN